jgi:hypothetical protein
MCGRFSSLCGFWTAQSRIRAAGKSMALMKFSRVMNRGSSESQSSAQRFNSERRVSKGMHDPKDMGTEYTDTRTRRQGQWRQGHGFPDRRPPHPLFSLVTASTRRRRRLRCGCGSSARDRLGLDMGGHRMNHGWHSMASEWVDEKVHLAGWQVRTTVPAMRLRPASRTPTATISY